MTTTPPLTAIAASGRHPDRLRELDRRLRLIVGVNVRAPTALIEDACQTAWLRLTRHEQRVPDRAVLAWLVTTATREALRLLQTAAREISLDALAEDPGSVPSLSPGPETIAELRGRLASMHELGERQRRLIWLQGLGFSYREMADHEHATLRTVERQVLRARRRLRAL